MGDGGYIEKFRKGLRLSSDVFDDEIGDLIDGARLELTLAGVDPIWASDKSDAIITMAVSTYVKAEFGLDNDDYEKYRASFERQKKALAMSTRYTTQCIPEQGG